MRILSILNLSYIILLNFIFSLIIKLMKLVLGLLLDNRVSIILLIIFIVSSSSILVSIFATNIYIKNSDMIHVSLIIFNNVFFNIFSSILAISVFVKFITRYIKDPEISKIWFTTLIIVNIIYANIHINLVDDRLNKLCQIYSNNITFKLNGKLTKCNQLNYRTFHNIIKDKNIICSNANSIDNCVKDLSYIENNTTLWFLLGDTE